MLLTARGPKVAQKLGEILSQDFQNGLTLAVFGDAVRLAVIKAGQLFYDAYLDLERAERLAKLLGAAAQKLCRQGGAGQGDVARAPEVNYGAIIIPSATLGGLIPLGEVWLTLKPINCLVLAIRGNLTLLRIFKDGEKYYEVELGGKQTEGLANFAERGAQILRKGGG